VKEDPLIEAQEALAKAQKQMAEVTRLCEAFPDLEVSTDRWDRKRLVSAKVNSIADQVDFRHNCGCCADSPLEARPFILFEGQQVFSDPDCFQVGEKNPSHYHDEPYDGWEERLRGKQISEVAIQLVRDYFAKEVEERRAELQAELEELEECDE